jgi:hypothetical protein
MASVVAHADIILSATVQLENHNGGPDVLGLHGATLNVSATFSGSYIDRFGFPEADSTSDSLTITGASVGGTNGVYSEGVSGDGFGLGFYPTFNGQLQHGGPNNGFAIWNIGGIELLLFKLLNEVGGVNVGDPVQVAHFGTEVDVGPSLFHFVGLEDNTTYAIFNLAVNVTDTAAAPVPAPLALIALGLLCLALTGRRR